MSDDWSPYGNNSIDYNRLSQDALVIGSNGRYWIPSRGYRKVVIETDIIIG